MIFVSDLQLLNLFQSCTHLGLGWRVGLGMKRVGESRKAGHVYRLLKGYGKLFWSLSSNPNFLSSFYIVSLSFPLVSNYQ